MWAEWFDEDCSGGIILEKQLYFEIIYIATGDIGTTPVASPPILYPKRVPLFLTGVQSVNSEMYSEELPTQPTMAMTMQRANSVRLIVCEITFGKRSISMLYVSHGTTHPMYPKLSHFFLGLFL